MVRMRNKTAIHGNTKLAIMRILCIYENPDPQLWSLLRLRYLTWKGDTIPNHFSNFEFLFLVLSLQNYTYNNHDDNNIFRSVKMFAVYRRKPWTPTNKPVTSMSFTGHWFERTTVIYSQFISSTYRFSLSCFFANFKKSETTIQSRFNSLKRP